MIGMHDSAGIAASFRQTKTPLNSFKQFMRDSRSVRSDRESVYAKRIIERRLNARLRVSNL
jgi:hypothetical protein